MDIGLEFSVIQNLVLLLAVLAVLAFIGLKRGWKGQLVTSGLMVLLWSIFKTGGDALIQFGNEIHRSLLFFAFCGTRQDPLACPRAADLARVVLVDPNNSDHRRMFFLISFTLPSVLAYLLVLRFGKPPRSVLHRLGGAVSGILSGFLVAYLLLPFAFQGEQGLLASPEAIAEENSPQILRLIPGLTTICQARASFIFLVLFVLFVIIAVRLIRPTKPQSDGHSEA